MLCTIIAAFNMAHLPCHKCPALPVILSPRWTRCRGEADVLLPAGSQRHFCHMQHSSHSSTLIHFCEPHRRAESQCGSAICSREDPLAYRSPCTLCSAVFSHPPPKRTKPWQGNLYRAQTISLNAFPYSHSHLTFKHLVFLSRYTTRALSHQESIYIHT